MSALGSLVVKLALEYAQYTGGLDKSEQATLASLKRIQGAADQFSTRVSDGLRNGLGGLAAFFTAGAIVSQVKSVVDELDRIGDAAAAIGITTQAMAELGFAANQSGTDAQTLEGAMGKLNLKISEGVGGNKEAVKLFADLGVQLRDTDGQVRSTEAVLADLADIFKALPEGPQKSALAVELFSKSGAGLLQFLSQGSDGIKGLREEFVALSGGSIEGAAEQAGAFNDQLDKLSVMGQAATIRFSSELLPTLIEVATMFTATGENALGMGEGMSLASLAGAGLRTLLEFVLLVGSDVAFVLHGIGNEVGGIAAQAVALAKFDFSAVGNIRTAMVEDAERARQKLEDFQRRVVNPGQAAAPAAPTTGDVSRGDRERAAKAAAAALRTEATAAKAAEDGYSKLMDSIRARLALADQQLALGRELTEGEKFQAKAKEDLAKIAAKLSSGQMAAAETEIAATKARIEQAEIEKQIAKELLTLAQDRQRVRMSEADGIAAWFAAQEEASASTLQGIKDRLDGLRNEEKAVAVSRERNISLAEAIEEVAIARLQEKQAGLHEGSEEWERIEREVAARRELVGLLGQQDIRQREEAGWSAMWESVDRTAHDVFVSVAEDGVGAFERIGKTIKASLLDMLYQMTVRKWVMNIFANVTGGGAGGVAGQVMGGAGGGGGGGLGDMMNFASSANSAYSLYSGGFGGTAIGQAYAGYTGATIPASMVGPSATPVSMWSNLGNTAGTWGSGAGGGATAGGTGTLAGAGIFAAIALAIGNALGVFRTDTLNGKGLSGMLGNGKELQPWEEWREGGTLFDGPSFSTMNPVAELARARERLTTLQSADTAGTLGNPQALTTQQAIVDELEKNYGDLAEATAKQSKAIQSAFDVMRDSAGDMADTLGLSSDKVREFTTLLGGEKGLNLDGLNPEEQQAKLAEALATANNELAQQILGTWETTSKEVSRVIATSFGHAEESGMAAAWETLTDTITETRYVASEYAKEGEQAIDTLTRLATSLSTVNDIFADLGANPLESSLAGGDSASQLADAFGGLENLQAGFAAYYEAFYSDAEKVANQTRRLQEAFAELGMEMPTTQAGFRALVTEQLALGSAGAETLAALIGLAPAFAGITDGVTSMQDAFSVSADSIKGILDNAIEQAGSAAEASRLASAAFEDQIYAGLQDGLTSQLAGLLSGAINPLINGLVGGAAASSAALAAGGAAAASSMATGGAIGASASAQGGAAAAGAMASGGSAAAGAMVGGGAAVGGVVASVLDQARAYVSAYSQILADPAIADMISQISGLVGDVAGLGYEGVSGGGGSWQSAGSPSAPLGGAADDYETALKNIGKTLEDEVKRLRGLMVDDSPQNRDVLLSRFATATAQARAGDETALAKLPELSRLLERATEESATSAVELARMRGWLAGSLTETMKLLGLDVPKFDVGTNYVPRDMLAMIHEGEAIVPKAYNPAAGGVDFGPGIAAATRSVAGGSYAELVQATRDVQHELVLLREQGDSNALHVQRLNLRTAKTMARVENILAMQ